MEENEVNLFVKMEAERANIPNILREDYFPIFVVKSLQNVFYSDTGGTEDYRSSHATQFKAKESDKWTDDSVLEEIVDFEGSFLLQDQHMREISNILKFAKEGIECGVLDKNKLINRFIREFEYPPLELLYFLDFRYEVFSLSSYILRLQALPQKANLQDKLLAFFFSPVVFSSQNAASNEYERSHKILERFLQCTLLMHYCNQSSKPDLKGAKIWTGEIIKEITKKLTNDGENKLPLSHHKMILTLLKEAEIPDSVRTRYYKDQLHDILFSSQTQKLSLMDILRYQEQYAEPSKLVILENFSATVSQIIRSLRQEDTIEIINSVIASPEGNWELLLYCIAIWVQEKQKKAITCLSELIKSQLNEGLNNKNEDCIMSAFTLARHCSLIASEIFSRYVTWYTNMFQSEAYSPAKTPETFTYLTSVLTKWVPTEPSCFLQPHTTYRPFIPPGCREIWNDYVDLAKARLEEYKEVEEAMEYEPNPNDPLQHDVEMAVKAYQTHKKIPASVHKLWNFQKQHYLNEFLPALLRKPTGISLTDARFRLIEVLKRDGKIPEEIYRKYKRSS